jgi:uncharacterized protein with von Willebrand factor type A (vWA) domain
MKKLGIVLAALAALVLTIGAVTACAEETTDDAAPPAEEATTDEAGGAGDEATTEEAEPELTTGQEQAIQAAESYLDLGGFSRAGLIGQLTSDAGEGFKKKDAVFAVDYLDPNWKQQAVISARSYMELGGFSLDNLIEQLESSAGDQFTHAQAVYGAKKAYNE